MMFLVRIIQSTRPCACYSTDPSSCRPSGQRTDPRSTSGANAHTLRGIHMAFMPNVSSIRVVMCESAKIRYGWSNQQPG
jgi:hypothetical protein